MQEAPVAQSSGHTRKSTSLFYRCVGKIGYVLRLRLEAQPGWAWRSAMCLLAWIMRLHALTLRYAVDDKAGYFTGRVDPAIFVLWHNRIAGMPGFYQRIQRYPLRPFVLASAGPEGSLLAEFLGHFGLGAVRGSASRRGSIGLREMTRRIHDGHEAIVTPDGSRGPRYHLQPGALYLAQRTGRPIIPLHVEYSRYFRFKTWDGFAIALPFAQMKVVFGEPHWIKGSCTDEQLEAERRHLEQVMTDSLVMR